MFSPVAKIPYIPKQTHTHTQAACKGARKEKAEPLQELSFYLAHIPFIGMLSNVNPSKPNILAATR